jgi:hypothetical protein
LSHTELVRQSIFLSKALDQQATEGQNKIDRLRAAFAKEKAARLQAEQQAALAEQQTAVVHEIHANNYIGT